MVINNSIAEIPCGRQIINSKLRTLSCVVGVCKTCECICWECRKRFQKFYIQCCAHFVRCQHAVSIFTSCEHFQALGEFSPVASIFESCEHFRELWAFLPVNCEHFHQLWAFCRSSDHLWAVFSVVNIYRYCQHEVHNRMASVCRVPIH